MAWANVSAPSDTQEKPPYCKICHRRAISGSRVCPHLNTAVPGGMTTPVFAAFRTGVHGRRLGAQLPRQKLVLCRRHLLQAHASLRSRSSSRVAAEAVKTLSLPLPSQGAQRLRCTSQSSLVADWTAKHNCLLSPRLSMSALAAPGAALGGANAKDSKGRRACVPGEEQYVSHSRCFVPEMPKSPLLLSLSEPLAPPTMTLPPPLNAAKATPYDTCAHALAETEGEGWDADESEIQYRIGDLKAHGGREVEGVAGWMKDSEEGGASTADQGTEIMECVEGSTLSPACAHYFHAGPSPLPRRGHMRRSSTGARDSPRALPETECKQEFSDCVLPVATFTIGTLASSPPSAGAGGLSAGGGRDAAAGAGVWAPGGGAAHHVELCEDNISWYKRLVAGAAGGGMTY